MNFEIQNPKSKIDPHHILIVDDEPSITQALKRLFRKTGYQLYLANSGNEALSILENLQHPISLIISDQRMPGMSGTQFLEKAKMIFPDAIRFILTGFSDMGATLDAINKGEVNRYFHKPWNDDELKLQVRQALDQYELKMENKRLTALTLQQNIELKDLNQNLEKKVEERSFQIIQQNKKLKQLNQELESNLYNTVRAFASLLKLDDPVLSGHAQRVSIYSREIAQQMELPNMLTVQIEIAGLLHDIGKIGLKEGSSHYQCDDWSQMEMELYQTHPVEGQNIVQFIDKLIDVGYMIRCHHENYDGSGWPDKLKEDQIPIGSRIIAVANAFDKMMNEKKAYDKISPLYMNESKIRPDSLSSQELKKQTALYYLRTNTSIIFDPDVVKVFLKILESHGIRFQNMRGLTINDLEADMILARSLYTEKGRFLLPQNTILTDEMVTKIKRIHHKDPIADIYCQI